MHVLSVYQYVLCCTGVKVVMSGLRVNAALLRELEVDAPLR